MLLFLVSTLAATRVSHNATRLPALQEFAGEYELAAMDMRGYGESDAPKVRQNSSCSAPKLQQRWLVAEHEAAL